MRLTSWPEVDTLPLKGEAMKVLAPTNNKPGKQQKSEHLDSKPFDTRWFLRQRKGIQREREWPCFSLLLKSDHGCGEKYQEGLRDTWASEEDA